MRLTGANKLMNIADGRFDGHAHVFDTSLRLTASRRYSPTHNALPQYYFDLLQTHGLDGGILVQPSFLGTNNSYLLNVLHEASLADELTMRGVIVVDPDINDVELARLKKRGIIGIRFNMVSGGQSAKFEIDNWSRVFRTMNDLGLHLELYCKSHELPQLLPSFLGHVERIVVDHFGMPDPHDPINDPGQVAIRNAPHGRVFVKTSGPYRVFGETDSNKSAERCIAVFKSLYDSIGPEQMLWGSDWPWTQFEERHSFASTLEWEQTWLYGAAVEDAFMAKVENSSHQST